MSITVTSEGFHVARWSDRKGDVFQAVEVWRGGDPILVLRSEGRNGNPTRWRGPERRTLDEAERDGQEWEADHRLDGTADGTWASRAIGEA